MIQLEVAFAIEYADLVAQLAQLQGQLALVHGVNFMLNLENIVVEQGTPFTIGALRHVHDHRMGVQLGILAATHFVAKLANDHVPRAFAQELALYLAPCLGELFDVVHGLGHRPVVSQGDIFVAGDECLHRHRFRRRECHVQAHAPLVGFGIERGVDPLAVRQLAIKQFGQLQLIDGADQAEPFGTFALPLAGCFLGVVVVCSREITCCSVLVVSSNRRDVEHATSVTPPDRQRLFPALSLCDSHRAA